jgi:endonuclease YncB( thermonuclease family)
MKRLACVLLLLVGCNNSYKVVGVIDGDTIDVLKQNQITRVRLAEIDAPEKNQAFGQQSKQCLSDLVMGKQVYLKDPTLERIRGKRTIATIIEGNSNINQIMVEKGMAWQYTAYSKSKKLKELQQEAKEKKKGLWFDKNPIPPWEYRKSMKKKKPLHT